MNRDFKGVWIRKEIWFADELTWMEKLFLTEIDSLDNEQGCFASNAYFAEFFKLSGHRCSQIINQMITKKYITAEYEREGKQIVKRVLRICHQGIKETSRRYQENVTNPIDNNVKENNTDFNNTSNKVKAKAFTLPTVKEIQEYCKERKNKVNAEKFFNYYESKGWLIGKTKMKNWKAAVRTWEQNNFEKSVSVGPRLQRFDKMDQSQFEKPEGID